MLDLQPYLKLMVDKEASDLFFSTEARVQIKIDGIVRPVGEKVLEAGSVQELALSMMNEQQRKEFENELEANFALNVPNMARFRVNVYRQRGEAAMVIRMIRSRIPALDQLQLPKVLKDLIMRRSGLVLVVGATGSGKSTTLAAMIDHRNNNSSGHILTIEDPIEFMHTSKRSLINQREVGIDTHSFDNALQNAMREAPDVILIGEIRDRNTMEQAIRYSETGHLCISTLHANNASQALDHITNFFSDSERRKVNQDLSNNLQGIISQRLVRDTTDKFMPVTEVLLNTPFMSELIMRGDSSRVREMIEAGGDPNMHTFDQSLLEYYDKGRISIDEVINNADSRNNVMLKLKLMGADF